MKTVRLNRLKPFYLKRTVRLGENDAETSSYGFGVRFDPPKTDLTVGFVVNKLFYELR